MLINLVDKKTSNSYFDKNMYKLYTNCKNFKLTYDINKKVKGNYPHVGVTAREGICVLYKYPDNDIWYNLDTFARRNPVPILMKNYSIQKHTVDNSEYELMILGPLWGDVSKLLIEYPDDSYMRINNEISERKILFAGGTYSFGIGCTTVGLKYSNILARQFNASKLDLCFNERKNHLTKVLEYYRSHDDLPQVDVGILEIDSFEQDINSIKENLKEIIEYMKGHCEHIIGWYCLPNSKNNKKQLIKEILKDEIKNDNIILVDMSFIYDKHFIDMCTLSNNFINDTGNIYIYKRLNEVIEGVTKWNI